MPYPTVKFGIDKGFDKWKIKEFLQREEKSDNLEKIIYEMHPELKKTDDIDDYIDRFYRDNLDKFTKQSKIIAKDWKKIEQKFFDYQNDIYHNLPWPKGDYIGFLSISIPYPRFLDSTTFQVSAFSTKESMAITAHELGHFIFFEYVRNRYAPKVTKLDEDQLNQVLNNKLKISLWELSEVHVVVLMNEDLFQKIIPNQSWPYSGHEKSFELCKELWKKSNRNIDKFFDLVEI